MWHITSLRPSLPVHNIYSCWSRNETTIQLTLAYCTWPSLLPSTRSLTACVRRERGRCRDLGPLCVNLWNAIIGTKDQQKEFASLVLNGHRAEIESVSEFGQSRFYDLQYNSELHRNLRSHYESIIQEESNKYKTEESYVKNAYISHPPNNTVLIATLYSVWVLQHSYRTV